ncbi:MAG: ABC transporter permease [Lactobacillus sp.]|jgi:osmoprotectant transport system permease protein|nr:ABC transporter permease [Lactobacillus sp.]MCH3906309.1 ABC transporter permease [Lactobacillus sp.]MCH3990116.1 ABC transporter permease [Lactobacillus sp.]MCH4069170.1 ABC transporter permease [Lactobacillus sp.]MCI1303472.1 ABC transporter permease [Lactobacillus sp.]
MLQSIIHYFQNNANEYWLAVRQHLVLSFSALIISLIIALPLGYLGSKNQKIADICQSFTQVLRIIPSLALLFILIPYVGTGTLPSLIALVILALPPLVVNTILGFNEVPTDLNEVALSLGMNNWQLLTKVQLPLSLPYLLNGIKLALIEIIASATLAAYIGAGGLGDLIMTGLGLYRIDLIMIGGISVAILSFGSMLTIDWLIRKAARNE